MLRLEPAELPIGHCDRVEGLHDTGKELRLHGREQGLVLVGFIAAFVGALRRSRVCTAIPRSRAVALAARRHRGAAMGGLAMSIASRTRHNAEAIADYLPGLRPTVVLMNPPFSASPGVDRIRHDADLRHIRSAFSMLPPGGRLVAIASAHCVPGDAAWVDAFASLVPPARVAFTAAIDGRAYARRGTTFDTRLTVLDRGGDERGRIDVHTRVEGAAQLLEAVATQMPPRLPIEPLPGADLFGHAPTPRPTPGRRARTAADGPQPTSRDWGTIAELAYEPAGQRPIPPGPHRPPAPTSSGGRAPSASRARSSIPRRWCSQAPWRRCRTRRPPIIPCCPPAS